MEDISMNAEWRQPHPRRKPTPSEVQETKQRIQEIDRTVEEISARIRNLERARTNLEQERTKHQSFIAPFRVLPTELLCEIAKHCLMANIPPYKLNQICSSMRYAVNGLNSLWNFVDITDAKYRWRTGPQTTITCQSLRFLPVILERASPLPLTLVIGLSEMSNEMLSILSPYSALIRSLKIRENDFTYSVIGQPLPELDLSLLQEFTLWGGSFDLTNITTYVFDAIAKSNKGPVTFDLQIPASSVHAILHHPAIQRAGRFDMLIEHHQSLFHRPSEDITLHDMSLLTEITIGRIKSSISIQRVPNLTCLDVSGVGTGGKLNVSDIPDGIQELRLEDIELTRHGDTYYTPRLLPKLRQVELVHASFAGTLDRYIQAPFLEDLTIYSSDESDQYDCSREIGFLSLNNTQGSHSLRTLRLSGVRIAGPLYRYLQMQTELNTLKLTACLIPEELLMQISDKTSGPFPQLAHFAVHYIDIEEGSRLHQFARGCADCCPDLKILVEIIPVEEVEDDHYYHYGEDEQDEEWWAAAFDRRFIIMEEGED